jgi:hypothetical protein
MKKQFYIHKIEAKNSKTKPPTPIRGKTKPPTVVIPVKPKEK